MKSRFNLLFMLTLITLAFVLVITGCGQGPKTPIADPTPMPTPVQGEALDESDLSPKETPAPTVTEAPKETISLYFSDKDLMKIYRIERVIDAVDKEALPKAALEEWIKGPGGEYPNLIGIMPPGVIVEYVKDVDGVAHVSFSKEIKSANLGSSGEIALIEQLVMVLQQFGFEQTQILVEGNAEESLLGHMETNKPIKANDPNGYEFIKKN
ncbi:MAG TPA: GerMN domain-containing protein [Bacilli bacterium]